MSVTGAGAVSLYSGAAEDGPSASGRRTSVTGAGPLSLSGCAPGALGMAPGAPSQGAIAALVAMMPEAEDDDDDDDRAGPGAPIEATGADSTPGRRARVREEGGS